MSVRTLSLAFILAAAAAGVFYLSTQNHRAETTPGAAAHLVQSTTAPSLHVAVLPATQPTVDPASTQPIGVMMTIGQQVVDFPPARIRLSEGDAGVTALLFSADPPNAIDNDYNGNSFYLSMAMKDVKDLSKLDGAQWHFKAESSERRETHDGVFLQGLRYHLQPQDVYVRLSRQGADVRVEIVGQLLAFDTLNRTQLGVVTPINADIIANVETKSAAR